MELGQDWREPSIPVAFLAQDTSKHSHSIFSTADIIRFVLETDDILEGKH